MSSLIVIVADSVVVDIGVEAASCSTTGGVVVRVWITENDRNGVNGVRLYTLNGIGRD